jgi:exosortase C (VPDSG-CTERM-specific)
MSDPLTQDTSAAAPAVSPVETAKSGIFTLRTHLGRFVWFTVVLIALFSKELVALAVHTARSDLHSYILLVPFISAYLIYTRRCELPETYRSSLIPTFVAMIAGLVTATIAWMIPSLSLNDHLSLTTASFVFFLTAGGFFFLGKQWMAAVAFPWAFLIFLVPMPDAMADALETASKLASTEAADLFFNMTGTPVLREGTIFQLPNIAIQVAQECSGIRSSWVLLITSLVAANLFLTSTWRRAILVCFVIPLGIVRNGFRVFVIGMLCVHFGPQMIHSIIHHRGGPLFFTLSLIPLFLLLLWLRRGELKRSGQRLEASGQM